MNIYLAIILAALLVDYCLHALSRFLDLKNLSTNLPDEFIGHYSSEEYTRSQEYLRENTRFSYFTSSFDLMIILLVIFLGIFNILDLWIRDFGFSPLISGLIFFGVLFFMQDILSTPFSLYRTFVIEEKFGFNKTAPKTYILDKFKSYILLLILGSLVLSLILYFFESFGDMAWLYAWMVLSAFLVLVQPLFTLVIAPMFNTFTPLEDGELKDKINQFARQVNFPISRIDVMDGSRRSSKANAYFSGLGKNKRIALFDTLIEQLNTDEIVSVIAHEVGHSKKKHIMSGLALGILHVGALLFLFSLVMEEQVLFDAFFMDEVSIYASLMFFGFVLTPIELLISPAIQYISRRNEYQADQWAVATTADRGTLVSGLKILAAKNLANLSPHSFFVMLNYSHPPLSKRIRSIQTQGHR